MNNWRGFPVFTSGAVVNPALWCVIAPTGSTGLAQNIPQYLIDRLNGQGIFVAGVHWRGCDFGEEDYGAWYFQIGAWINDMKAEYGLTANPVLYAQSRGGLQLLNFATEAPSLVSRIAALYPVADPNSYPARGGALNFAHNKNDAEWDAIKASGKSVISRYIPNENAAALISTSVCIWHGDQDTAVPKSANTDIFAPKCRAWVKTLTGYGHVTPLQSWLDEIVYFIQWGVPPSGAVQQ